MCAIIVQTLYESSQRPHHQSLEAQNFAARLLNHQLHGKYGNVTWSVVGMTVVTRGEARKLLQTKLALNSPYGNKTATPRLPRSRLRALCSSKAPLTKKICASKTPTLETRPFQPQLRNSSGSPLGKAAPIPRAVGKEGRGQENQTDGLWQCKKPVAAVAKEGCLHPLGQNVKKQMFSSSKYPT